ncbi:MAG: aspartate kinase [Anaerolineaceae bacterium]|nr:MAG: aspartate kinase [Anaerolineaceae bacterium]
MGTLVMKFGGVSVATTTALTQVISIVLQEKERWQRLIVVASALEGVTDALIEAARLAQLSNQRGYRRIVATIRTRHLALVEQLPLSADERNALNADIDQLLFEMLDVCQALSDALEDRFLTEKMDAIIGVGERLSARIIAALLRENDLRGVAIESMNLLVTDDIFGNATPDIQATRARVERDLLPMLERDIIPVITGFVGGTVSGKPTTVGRGGSDYTASVLAACAGADEVWMWTSVDGMMSADPGDVEAARVIPAMSYEEVAELAYFGARILHARMVQPLRDYGIPLRIKNVFKPQQTGTFVHHSAAGDQIKAVTSIGGLGLRTAEPTTLTAISKLVNRVFTEVIGTSADVMLSAQSSSATFLSVIVPTSAGLDATRSLQSALRHALKQHPEVGAWTVEPISVITAVAAGINRQPRLLSRLFFALDDAPLLAVAQGPSHCSLSVVVARDDADAALQRIHQHIIG